MKEKKKIVDNILTGLISMVAWTIVVVGSFSLLIEVKALIGPVMLVLGVLVVFSIFLFHKDIRCIIPDLWFGAIDNGVLIIFALIGAEMFGVLGAIIGGAIGNAVSDGFAGIFEGHASQELTKKEQENARTPVRSALGKMAGCLIGAGILLIITWTILGL